MGIALHRSKYELAVKGKDHASQAFLQWFVTEQVEEERLALQTVETLQMVGRDGTALLLLDRELANPQARPAIGAENRALEGQAGA
jgi:ferritin